MLPRLRRKLYCSFCRKDQDAVEKLAKASGGPDKVAYAERLVIAWADTLVSARKFDHAAEFLKACLRQGICNKPWMYESLAIALQLSNGSPEEIERAQVSAIDLQPQDAQGYLRASKGMAELKRWDRAVAFCKQASLMDPNRPEPYAEALLYAEVAKDTDGMAWAAITALLRDRFNANEILVSLMLVYVAELLLAYLVYGPWKDPKGYNFPQTITFLSPTQIPLVFEDTRLHLRYPPDRRTEEATLREGQRCAREGITINIFLLNTWNQSKEDVRFAYRLAESTRGRVFFTAGRELDRYVVWDYIKRRRQIIA